MLRPVKPEDVSLNHNHHDLQGRHGLKGGGHLFLVKWSGNLEAVVLLLIA